MQQADRTHALGQGSQSQTGDIVYGFSCIRFSEANIHQNFQNIQLSITSIAISKPTTYICRTNPYFNDIPQSY
jgi:hypothetical protein